MSSATIKLFLADGDARGLRTAEISNWTGKALAAPRTRLDKLLSRKECEKPGVYVLTGSHPDTNKPLAYIGEAEVIRDRLKQQKSKEFWVAAIVFVSKDENLTKAHVRYLENRLLAEARQVGRFVLEQNQASGSKLPESDVHDMEVFLSHARLLLPVLGSDLLSPLAGGKKSRPKDAILTCRVKGAEAKGQRTPDGFVVFQGSTAVLQERPSAAKQHPFVPALREQLTADGTLVQDGDYYVFTRDWEASSPSSAASVVHGGGASGPREWRTNDGRTLKELDEAD